MSMDSVTGSQLLSGISQSSSPRMDCDQLSIKSDLDDQVIPGSKVKLMCSYGGVIMPRPHDSQLRYIGGDTRILVVPRSISYSDLCLRFAKLCGPGPGEISPVFPKYKLPYEDYDALVSVVCDEDLETMLDEYDRLGAREAPSKLRVFIFPRKTPVSPMGSFDLTTSDREQSFFEALNSSPIQQQIQETQRQMLFDDPSASSITSSAQQEVIVDAQGASACSSGSSMVAVQKMIEADSALQSDLPPILTEVKNQLFTVSESSASVVSVPVSTLFTSNLEPEQLFQQQFQQQQQRIIQPAVSQALIQQQVSQLAPIQSPPQQTLPPRGPKSRVSGISSPQDQKKDSKKKLEASGSPKTKGVKDVLELEPSALFEALENLKVVEVNRGEKTVGQDEEQGIVSGGDNQVIKNRFEFDSTPTVPMNSGSINVQEMSLDVFMEQEKLKQQPVFVQPQQFQAQFQAQPQSPAKIQAQFQALAQPQSPAQIQAQQYYQQQQPYIIENNMVYYLASADQITGAPFQLVQQRPAMQAVQYQRGGSGPLMTRQQNPPLQRQLSASTYVEQFQKPPQQVQQVQLQQQQQQQQQKAVFPVTRMGPGAQSPSRFRDQMILGGNLAPQHHFAVEHQQQQRNVDPVTLAAVLAQQQQQQMPGYSSSSP